MRAVLSLGGSVLVPEVDADAVGGYAATIEEVVGAGVELGVVVGGGSIAREYIGAARQLAADEVALDRLGIDATRLNARLLAAGLDSATLADDYEAAEAAIGRGETAVMGGVAPGQTTDMVAAVVAEATNADLLVYGTATDGVYDADPETDPDASKFSSLTPTELVEVIAPMSRTAGASAPVDLLAAKLIERAGLHTVVLDATDPDRIADAILDGDHDGTNIAPDA